MVIQIVFWFHQLVWMLWLFHIYCLQMWYTSLLWCRFRSATPPSMHFVMFWDCFLDFADLDQLLVVSIFEELWDTYFTKLWLHHCPWQIFFFFLYLRIRPWLILLCKITNYPPVQRYPSQSLTVQNFWSTPSKRLTTKILKKKKKKRKKKKNSI